MTDQSNEERITVYNILDPENPDPSLEAKDNRGNEFVNAPNTAANMRDDYLLHCNGESITGADVGNAYAKLTAPILACDQKGDTTLCILTPPNSQVAVLAEFKMRMLDLNSGVLAEEILKMNRSDPIVKMHEYPVGSGDPSLVEMCTLSKDILNMGKQPPAEKKKGGMTP